MRVSPNARRSFRPSTPAARPATPPAATSNPTSASTSPARRIVEHPSAARIARSMVVYARRNGEGISAEVGPVLVPFTHPFARATGVENVVRVVGASAGPLLFSGAGAGRDAAASAVLGDLVATLRAIAERHASHASRSSTLQTPRIDSAFDRFPEFAGYPILTTPSKGDTHVGYSSRTLSAV